MSYEPCLNPNCKSQGKPHPNCRCYGSFAGGGVAEHFCAKKQPHEIGCEYYADGGTVESPLHVDPSQSVAGYLAHEGLHGLLKMKSDGDENEALEKYNASVKRGDKHHDKKIDHLFSGKPIEPEDHTKSKKAIHDWISKGGITNDIQQELYNTKPQMMAEGGEAEKKPQGIFHDHPMAKAYPEQNMMLQAAKGRMSNYLNSLRPQENMPKLTFDQKPDDTHQKKTYDKALTIAAHPLSVLEHAQKGNLESEHMSHLKNLHPEVDDMMQKKLTERITKAQLSGEKPSYKVRQSLGTMLNAPMGSEMTQPNLAAIQAVFQTQQSQQQAAPVTKNKKNTSTLSKASQPYLTSNEARIARQQRET